MTGRRVDGSNARAVRSNPRAAGRSPRQRGTNPRALSLDAARRDLDGRWAVRETQRALAVMRANGDACDECGGRTIRDRVRCSCPRVTIVDAVAYLAREGRT